MACRLRRIAGVLLRPGAAPVAAAHTASPAQATWRPCARQRTPPAGSRLPSGARPLTSPAAAAAVAAAAAAAAPLASAPAGGAATAAAAAAAATAAPPAGGAGVAPTFQEAVRRLQDYWARAGCLVWLPHNTEVGAGTMNPATFLRCGESSIRMGPKGVNGTTTYTPPYSLHLTLHRTDTPSLASARRRALLLPF